MIYSYPRLCSSIDRMCKTTQGGSPGGGDTHHPLDTPQTDLNKYIIKKVRLSLYRIHFSHMRCDSQT